MTGVSSLCMMQEIPKLYFDYLDSAKMSFGHDSLGTVMAMKGPHTVSSRYCDWSPLIDRIESLDRAPVETHPTFVHTRPSCHFLSMHFRSLPARAMLGTSMSERHDIQLHRRHS